MSGAAPHRGATGAAASGHATDRTDRTDPWHTLSAEAVAARLGSHPVDGLSDDEAAARLAHHGENRLPVPPRRSAFLRFAAQFAQPLVLVLILAGAVTALLGEYVDALVILGVVLVNAAIGFVQEGKAEAALAALARALAAEAVVVRAGRRQRLGAHSLVPGDLVLLAAGDRVPADLRLVEARGVQAMEASLTGESTAVGKLPAALPAGLPLAERSNMAYAGTMIVSGQGAGLVAATGAATETGRVSRLIAEAPELQTPLTKKMAAFSNTLLVVIGGLALLTFGVGLLRGEAAFDMFMAAVALSVGAIPEGLPAAVTITLAIGVSRMAKRRAIIRRLPAVEALGGTTVICSDKTGTLTENQMTVCEIWVGGEPYEVSGAGYAPEGRIASAADASGGPPVAGALRELLIAGALCNDAGLFRKAGRWEIAGDPTEGALLVLARKGGLDETALRAARPRLDVLPFDSTRQYMATRHGIEQGPEQGSAQGAEQVSACGPDDGPCPGRREQAEPTGTGAASASRQESACPGVGAPNAASCVYLKGAVERLLPRCVDMLAADGALAALDVAAIERHAQAMAGRGLRVLALACACDAADGALADGVDQLPLSFIGLVAMIDPPRPRAVEAVRACHGAGIRVKMITGDHALTALAIARRIGIEIGSGSGGESGVLTGSELAAMDDAALARAAVDCNVFARVEPEQKLRLVLALQQRGEVVAMTGDGVNDAPALKSADIGIAMGLSGTDVAREAAAMVLTDDNFASIEAAVEEGRGVYDNLVKFITWTLPTNFGEGLVIVAAILAGATLPITPLQILWINMSTAVLLGLVLAFEPVERGVMRRPPRPPAAPILDRALVWRIVLVGTLLLVGAYGLFLVAQQRGATIAEARTVAVNVFVVVQAFYLLNCRSLTRSFIDVGAFSNPWLWGGIGLMAALQLLFTYLPTMNRLFGTAPIGLVDWAAILAFGVLAFLAVGLEKRLRPFARPSRG
ncbi:MAG: HAD-IC family P-type ATPase [Azospira sp.]|jgi:magnesium-transporting ATPase (P-type)|nr:HAD-IC family P-type ATPase [Azospira sp.]